MLNRDTILGAADLKTASVEVPEWGGTISFRVMTGTERRKLQKLVEKDPDHIMEYVIVFTAVDEEGKNLFAFEDFKPIGEKSAPALERCFKCAGDLNGLTKGSIDRIAGE